MPNKLEQWKLAQEEKRLETLRRLSVMDTPREERFDIIARLLARDFDVPMAMISLLDDRRAWLKSKVGLDPDEVPRDITFCAHALDESHILVVEDAWLDPRFANNPLVIGEPGIRFYAGAVIRSPDREPLGAVCIMDRRPRHLSYSERRQLIDLAGHVGREMAISSLAPKANPAG